MDEVSRGWDDFWAELFRVRHRRAIQGIREYDKMIVDFCINVLDLKEGMSILDIACGAGDHCIEFAKQNLRATGFDIANSLIEHAKTRAKEEGLDITLFQGDMREISFENKFDAAVILSHSFGFFNHEENMNVLKHAYHALREGGRLLLDLINPYRLPQFQKNWIHLEGGFLLNEPHVLDAQAGVLRGRPAIFIDVDNGVIIHMSEDALANNDIRVYTALEIRKMLEEVGFSKFEVYGSNKLPRMPYSAGSARMVVVATK